VFIEISSKGAMKDAGVMKETIEVVPNLNSYFFFRPHAIDVQLLELLE
jgi:hypothetical protein